MTRQKVTEGICNEILSIMETYHEQEKSAFGVDTPGGLEHMGDVWSKFLKWEAALRQAQEDKWITDKAKLEDGCDVSAGRMPEALQQAKETT